MSNGQKHEVVKNNKYDLNYIENIGKSNKEIDISMNKKTVKKKEKNTLKGKK